MHVFILGICGTFMGSLAVLAKELGYRVSGCDSNVYPPMSTQLEEQGISLMQGYEPAHLQDDIDLVVIGNALSRGNPLVEAVLDRGLPYTSGPQWLQEHVLQGKWVLGVAGTHGKTTTSSMLAWILDYAGLQPGYLIGGVPGNFHLSARLGGSDFFVVEADEYDSAFFDKRSKFVHYRPSTAILNNLEFDHADIFADLAAIQRQFHHLLRTVPGRGLVITPAGSRALKEVIDMGCWTPVQTYVEPGDESPGDWWAELITADGSEFQVLRRDGEQVRHEGTVRWTMSGAHNVSNALAAIIAARSVGVEAPTAIQALAGFMGVKRRMELLDTVAGISVYDDFAHHPTAILTTLEGLRAKVGDGAVIAIIEPRSNTMRLGSMKDQLPAATKPADEVWWFQSAGIDWQIAELEAPPGTGYQVFADSAAIIEHAVKNLRPGSHVVIMSNGGVEGLHARLLEALRRQS